MAHNIPKHLDARERDIQKLCKQVLSLKPYKYDTVMYNASVCKFCDAEKFWANRRDEPQTEDIEHKPNCAYLIAKDLSTGRRKESE